MSKKVFRIHNDGPTNTDWFESLEPGAAVAKAIKDKDKDIKELPSSIPSPFARMDLVRTAFAAVNGESVDGDSYHHKLVSDALDIGQILFNYDKHGNELELLAWNKESQLKALKSSVSEKHQALGETLELFLQQDKQFNFPQTDTFYILKHQFRVIGGISPVTLFFAAPFNDRKTESEQKHINIQFGNDVMLDEHYLPLYSREPNYIKYLFALSRRPGFADAFGELYEYIQTNVRVLEKKNPSLFNELNALHLSDYFNALAYLSVSDQNDFTVNALSNFPLYKLVSKAEDISSDFAIDSEHKVGVKGQELTPLVLPVDAFNYPLQYTYDNWNSAKPAPFYDEVPLSERRLPHVKDHYPYLTISDFLEDHLIQLPYNLNSNNFYNVGQKYLLPLKSMFFEYFTVERLIKENLFSLKEYSNSVEVSLKVPIKGKGSVRYITYTKQYKQPSESSSVGGFSGIGERHGVMVEAEATLAITPFFKGRNFNPDYRIGLLNRMSNATVELSFYQGKAEPVKIVSQNERLKSDTDLSYYYLLRDAFDFIQLQILNTAGKGILIPLLEEYQESALKYSFAIDFGTSNTHIEYKTNQMGDSEAFSLTPAERHIGFSFSTDEQSLKKPVVNQSYFQFSQEMHPEKINEGSKTHPLPMRTVLLCNSKINIHQATYTYNHYNIGFSYEKKQIQPHLFPKTNIKWSNYNDTESSKQLNHYIEHLLMLLKAKVIANHGNLNETEITWFYPSSMGEGKIKSLTRVWDKQVEGVFGKKVKLQSLPESMAPFYYYRSKLNVVAQELPVVSLDIGGGTADVVVYHKDTPQLITSFKFAGNAIFGDGYGGSLQTNGFLKKHLAHIEKVLGQNSPALNDVLKQLKANKHSDDIINFLFSLVTNKELKEKGVTVDFASMLADDEDHKLVFVLYYGAVFYHLIKILAIKEFKKPMSLLLSGSGSKTAFIADVTDNKQDLTLLFNKIYDKLIGGDQQPTSIRIEENPKEVTAKGGLFTKAQDLADLEQLTMVALGGNDQYQRLFKPFNTREETGKLSYEDVSEKPEVFEEVVDEVFNFLHLFKELHKEVNFKNKFAVSQPSIDFIDKVLEGGRDALMNDLKAGFEQKKSELGADSVTTIEETLFFYPLIGILNKLAQVSQNSEAYA